MPKKIRSRKDKINPGTRVLYGKPTNRHTSQDADRPFEKKEKPKKRVVQQFHKPESFTEEEGKTAVTSVKPRKKIQRRKKKEAKDGSSVEASS